MGEELIDPETGLSLGGVETKVGSARVVQVQDRFSIAETVSLKGEVSRGDKVVSTAPPPEIEFAPTWEKTQTRQVLTSTLSCRRRRRVAARSDQVRAGPSRGLRRSGALSRIGNRGSRGAPVGVRARQPCELDRNRARGILLRNIPGQSSDRSAERLAPADQAALSGCGRRRTSPSARRPHRLPGPKIPAEGPARLDRLPV